MNMIKLTYRIIGIILILCSATIYSQQKSNIYHPGGIVGKLSFHTDFRYYSVSKDPQFPITDIQKYKLKLGWVAAPKLLVTSQIDIINEDSIYYEFEGGISYYLKNPLISSYKINPDGTLGGVVITVKYGLTLFSNDSSKSRSNGLFQMKLPLTGQLSVEGGYRYYEEISKFDVRQFIFGIKYYSASYSSNRKYYNPDGNVGNLVIHLLGGFSKEGEFGDLSLLFPIKNDLTLKALLSYEKTDYQNKESKGLGIGFSYYPSN